MGKPAFRAGILAMAGVMLWAAAGCGGTAAVSPPAAATLNSFLTAFLAGHVSRASQLTTAGVHGARALTDDRARLKALTVNVPPFAPLATLHWQTHCAGLTCTVTFSPLDTHQIPSWHVTLAAVGRHARLPIGSLSPWLASIGRS